MRKVVHLTSVHHPRDPRIFEKQCKSLKKNGYEVVLVAPHTHDEVIDGIQIRHVPVPRNGHERIFRTQWNVYRTARKERGEIYHFHDPELIPIGLLLRMSGARVIYDVHEDYITSIHQKGYIPGFLRKLLAWGMTGAESLARKAFHVILAERYYEQRFPDGHKVLNYPSFNIIHSRENEQPGKHLLYTGTVSKDRGALNLAYLAQRFDDVNICVIGRCPEDLYENMKRIAGESNKRLHVVGVGKYIPHREIIQTYETGNWLAGLALFPPTPHYVNKELTKFFEYMAAGIPLLCSDFPVWKQLVDATGAGICVDPDDTRQISDAIDYLYANPDVRQEMGRAGRQAVQHTFNWEQESKKLLGLYDQILNKNKVPEFEPV